ncbi:MULTISPECIES: FtsQ-type POTRA domain-containing protein [unclassified Actinomyces]|uniref:cell division protein FtsQ/DivIB n=1 Tax=unclassified Actinomyces TaxID=2609248 RepID=UPI0013A6DD09|nr:MULTISPECIES: FtsQ-type POTRA domain-containing protein [unclassified Actinomyces]MBW3069735.1 FtsQ-type POTRA domain-containing protein [Actinomyces sp. 594]NDR52764.1 FtsQ-type POTRA domain-containing protein [Actinomyces sp. 565]
MMRKPSRPRPRGAAAESVSVPSDPARVDAAGDPVQAPAAAPAAVEPLQARGDQGSRALGSRGVSRDRVVSSGLSDRLEERRRARRRLGRGRLVRAAGAAAVIALLVWACLFSPLLGLRPNEITVTGADGSVDAGDVQAVLAPHRGQSLLRLDVTALGEEVADSLVTVRSAAVTRSWPHGLAVRLTMRIPVAVRQVDAGYEVLDGEAVVLETAQRAPEGLAVIAAEPGQELSESQVSAVTEAIGSLDPETRTQVSGGRVSQTGQVTLTLVSGATVMWGQSTDNELKARVLAVLLRQEADTYDVSSPHSPTTS